MSSRFPRWPKTTGKLCGDSPRHPRLESALTYPGIDLLPLTVAIAVESTKLPGDFHRDPADQLLVATSRIEGIPLATADRKILDYSEVETLDLGS